MSTLKQVASVGTAQPRNVKEIEVSRLDRGIEGIISSGSLKGLVER